MKSAKSPISLPRESRFWVALFAVLCLALFLGFALFYPVRFRTPQPLRLRYSSLQTDVRFGPLSSSWADFKWQKAFDWQAGDTEYRVRQFSQFFEILMPRLYTYIWYHTGPFLWYPFDLFLTLLIAVLIILIVRGWTHRTAGGIVAAGFWMVTLEVLIGHQCPVRPTKSLVTVEILVCLLLLLGMRGRTLRRAVPHLFAFNLVVFLSFFTDEYGLFAVPLYIIILLGLKKLRPVCPLILLSMLVLGVFSLFLFLYVFPGSISPDGRQAFFFTKSREMLNSLLSHHLPYGFKNALQMLKCTFGWFGAYGRAARFVLLACYASLLFLVVSGKAWNGSGWPLGIAALFAALAGFLLLPAGTNILYQYTYYNRPVVALVIVVLGALTTRVLYFSHRLAWAAWLIPLLVIGAANVRYGIREVTVINEEYWNRSGGYNILGVEGHIRRGELVPPVYLAYPRYLNSREAVWIELEYADDFEQKLLLAGPLYRSLTPLLYLRRFEEGSLLADPTEFKIWEKEPEVEYLNKAKSYYDIVSGETYRIDLLWKIVSKMGSNVYPEWMRINGGKSSGVYYSTGFWGFNKKAVLSAGRWRAAPTRRFKVGENAVLIAVIRGTGKFKVRIIPSSNYDWRECGYCWCYELLVLDAGVVEPDTPLFLEVDAPGGAEVLGPILLPASTLTEEPLFKRLSGR